jgi:predicted nucleotidyltransferase
VDNNATLARGMGLKPHQYQLIHDFVFSHPKVRYAWVFGSRATGSFRDNSDIDILIEGDTLTLNDVAIVLKNQVQSSELIKRIKEEAKQVK